VWRVLIGIVRSTNSLRIFFFDGLHIVILGRLLSERLDNMGLATVQIVVQLFKLDSELRFIVSMLYKLTHSAFMYCGGE